jgi:asparagine synthase (glutamine-hydrolysing)
MSGIAGMVRFDGASIEAGQIEKITAFMSTLGPHGRSHWVDGPVALGHCMLRSTPESAGERQPLACPQGKRVLVWDGRLDNREDLERELAASGALPKGDSDAEMVLHSYLEWGENCTGKLEGDFAFALWDAGLQRLFCACDHMGARPFYYTLNPRFFAFASEEEALLALPGVSGEPAEELIAHLLVDEFECDEADQSWLKDVRFLLPGNRANISIDGEMRRQAYWAPEPGPEAVYRSDGECEEAFAEVFGRAVRERMRSAGGIAAMISGGLDSAGIMAMASRLLADMPGRELHTYSAISDHPQDCLESRSIQSLTRMPGARPHYLSVPSFTGMAGLNELVEAGWSRAHPVDNSILLPAMMCQAASRNGHRVMLHGMGGDYTMRVPGRHIAYILRSGAWREALKESLAASRNCVHYQGQSPLDILLKNAWAAYAPLSAKRRRFRRQLSNAPSPLAASAIKPEWAAELGVEERIRDSALATRLELPDLQESHVETMRPPNGYIVGLNGYNRVAARHGIEFRDPWSDRGVMEFWLRLPLRYKIRRGWTKFLLRKTFETELEPLLRRRKDKQHLGWNFAWRLMQESGDLAERITGPEFTVLDRYVDRSTVRRWYTERSGNETSWPLQQTFDVITLGLWLNRISR